MPRVKKLDLGMTALDELFMNDKERAENKLPKIFDIPLSEIDDFPDHPYRVLDDEDMQNLMESIRDRGVITPAMVRKKHDGRYEMISGHRRKHASERLGLETLRCEVVEVSRDEAIILMVDSNAQRSEILPCDKGRAYKMKLDAIKRQGQRTDLTSTPVGPKLGERSNDELAEQVGDSHTQIQRYIRLTYLVPELQEFVDKGQMKMRPAVELSYLDEETQRDIVDRIDETEAFPSHDQAIRIRKAFEAGEINYDNRAKGKNTFIIIDEIYLLFQHEYSANFLFTLWKRVRKYGAFCTGITQNVDDLLQSHTARTMLANSEFVIMLNQASTDRIKLAELLNISDTQLSYITNVEAGRGLMKVGSALVPFVNKFPKNTKLYALMTTKFGER